MSRDETPDRDPDERPPAEVTDTTVPADHTIDPSSEVEESSLESFPASDPPGYAGGTVTARDFDPAGDGDDQG